jgi:hypothetical protein
LMIILPALIGGAIVAVIGFVAAYFERRESRAARK